jgi:hypothetical protein
MSTPADVTTALTAIVSQMARVKSLPKKRPWRLPSSRQNVRLSKPRNWTGGLQSSSSN